MTMRPDGAVRFRVVNLAIDRRDVRSVVARELRRSQQRLGRAIDRQHDGALRVDGGVVVVLRCGSRDAMPDEEQRAGQPCDRQIRAAA